MAEKKQFNYTIDTKGSLGLLANGHKGLRAWREVKKQHLTLKAKDVKK